jgi:hypothetical protein
MGMRGALVMVLVTAAGCGMDQEAFDPTAEGCMLTTSLAGYGPGGGGGIFFPSGFYELDVFYDREGFALVNEYQVQPRGFYYLDGATPNAMATSQVVTPYGPDGTVVFGMTLLQQEFQADPEGRVVRAIMAHEFAHLVQFKRGLTTPGKRPELQADYMAGWYSFSQQVSMDQLEPILMSFFQKGDYAFNSPHHHGTPGERIAAVRAGYDAAWPTIDDAWAGSEQYLAGVP